MTVVRPLAEVFAVFEDPHNLARITPPWLNFRVLTEGPITMKAGAVIDYRFRWFVVPLRWRTVISSYTAPEQFVDEALRSPYSYWRHRHEFFEVADGVRVCDTVDYGLPMGWLGRAAHEFAVRRNLLEIFRYRQTALNEMWGGGARIEMPEITRVSRTYPPE